MGFPGSDSLTARHRAIRNRRPALGLDGLVVTNPTNIRDLSNHAGSAGTLVVTHSEVHLLVDFRYEESVRPCRPLMRPARACGRGRCPRVTTRR